MLHEIREIERAGRNESKVEVEVEVEVALNPKWMQRNNKKTALWTNECRVRSDVRERHRFEHARIENESVRKRKQHGNQEHQRV